MTQPDPKRVSADWISARSQLTLFDLAGGAPGTARVIAPDQDVFPGTIAWAPDADRRRFSAGRSAPGFNPGSFRQSTQRREP